MVDSTPATPVKTDSKTIEMPSSPIFNGFPKLLKDPKFSDLTVSVGTKPPVEFKLHRAILAERSTFFNRLLHSAFIESKTQEVKLPEIKPRIFTLVVRYLYTGEYDDKIEPDEMVGIYETADYFDIPDLKESIMDIVWKKVENFAEELDVKIVIAVLGMLAKTMYDTVKLEKLIQKLLERKKLGYWMEKPSFKELLDTYGILGRLIIENGRIPGLTPVPKGWAKADIKPKVFCRACSAMKNLARDHPSHTYELACGHQANI
ncbi:kelch-like 11 [Orbilia ellipsospora]|uniref:Kelch-like 11 n=1 Tax=Orbilia ellipsospora TaxID=2528407 RepID=A0AAV9XA99_9PEZI